MKIKNIIMLLLLVHSSCNATVESFLDRLLCSVFGVIVVPEDDSVKTIARVSAQLIAARSGAAIQTQLPASTSADGSHKEAERLIFERIKPENKFIIK